MNSKINSYEVTFKDVDFRRCIKIPCLVNYLLQTATLHADENDFGIQFLQNFGCTWVLSRMVVEVETYPMQNEIFSVETWIESVNRLILIRNFCVRNAEGKIIGSATASLATIDIKTRQAVNLVDRILPYATNRPALCHRSQKLPDLTVPSCNKYTVKYSDIDLNGHANSSKYIEWLIDCIEKPFDFFEQNHVANFEILYISEALIGDKLFFYKQEKSEKETLFEIRRGERPICKMSFSIA